MKPTNDNKKQKRSSCDTKQVAFRANRDMMARFAQCDDRAAYIRSCIDRVIQGHINLEEEMYRQMPRYQRGVRTQAVVFRAPGYMWQYIDSQADRGCFIRACIQAQMELESPLATGTPNMERIMFNPQANDNIRVVEETVQCGIPMTAEGDAGEWQSLQEVLNFNPDEMFLMRARGNSMIDAYVESGDFLVIRRGNHVPMPQELAVCQFNGEFTLKHFFMYKDSGWLYPDNEEFEPIRVQKGVDTLSFQGTVHRIIKNPKRSSHFDYDRCLEVMKKES